MQQPGKLDGIEARSRYIVVWFTKTTTHLQTIYPSRIGFEQV